ncbi:hypothetical protein K0B96_10830 [Horticoccus luteus]|uniref:Uncharacterized protein n=1 Tax=Horticoccus luteus TaxID=2862869 RepID=A0A8F9XG41_9BACT|nr:hypothetical protein [Horticoccus luteus]QYM77815.1 hypothetical protein K0B96_10830 [Horticoccus luteus]
MMFTELEDRRTFVGENAGGSGLAANLFDDETPAWPLIMCVPFRSSRYRGVERQYTVGFVADEAVEDRSSGVVVGASLGEAEHHRGQCIAV